VSAIAYIRQSIIPVTLGMLPTKMDSPAARAMLLAIGLQESRFTHRKQIGGPAHGFWQFERGGGVVGVLNHASTRTTILSILDAMGYDATADTSYEAITDNDVLAGVFARMLLWTHPRALPSQADQEGAWFYYINCWRPGRPHRSTWDEFYETAWGMV
jgi:hypothetical protein